MTTSDTGPFALIPEWVLYQHISDKAIRLYCVLGRFADREGESYPSRQTLADRLGCSRDSVDRSVKELIAIGALEKVTRFNPEGDPTSNLWKTIRARPGTSTDAVTPSRVDEVTGSPTDAALTRTTMNENHIERKKAGVAANKPQPRDYVHAVYASPQETWVPKR